MTAIRMIGEGDVREQGFAPIAFLQVSRAELAERGVELTVPIDDGTWEEAGPIEAALVEAESGEQALFIWHLAFENNPAEYPAALELRAPQSTEEPRAHAEAFLRALRLPNDRCVWLAGPAAWPPYPALELLVPESEAERRAVAAAKEAMSANNRKRLSEQDTALIYALWERQRGSLENSVPFEQS